MGLEIKNYKWSGSLRFRFEYVRVCGALNPDSASEMAIRSRKLLSVLWGNTNSNETRGLALIQGSSHQNK